jgi:hypothetical protein
MATWFFSRARSNARGCSTRLRAARIYIHKERELHDVEKHYPANHYVRVDDKLHILTAVKKVWGSSLTTVFPRQGHYAHDPKILATCPHSDITIECIGDLLQCDLSALLAAGQADSTRDASKPIGDNS